MSNTSRQYYLDTRYAVNPTTPHRCEWFVPELSLSDYVDYKMQLTEAIIPNSRYVIRTNVNDAIAWFEDDTVGTADLSTTIAPGFYSGSTIATTIASAMTAESASSGLTITYSGTYDSTTKKVTITPPIPNTLYIKSVTNDMYTEVPFTVSTTLAPSQSSGIVNLAGTLYVDVACNIGNQNVSTNSTRSIIARIPMGSPGGSIHYYQNESSFPIKITSDQFENLEIDLFDDEGNRFVLPSNTHCSYTLSFIS